MRNGKTFHWPLAVENIDRSVILNFEAYMRENPYYFEEVSGMPLSEDNLRELEGDRDVAIFLT